MHNGEKAVRGYQTRGRMLLPFLAYFMLGTAPTHHGRHRHVRGRREECHSHVLTLGVSIQTIQI